MLEPLEVAALALPVSDLILDIFERCRLAKIRDREDRRENGLKSDVVALFRDQVHLQEPVVRFALDLDQVRDLRRGVDLRKIHTFRRLARSPSKPRCVVLKRIVDHMSKKRAIKNLLQFAPDNCYDTCEQVR